MPTPDDLHPGLVRLIEQARRTGNYDPVTDAIPYAKFMGIHVTSEGGHALTCMRYAAHLIGNPMLPALHGGTLGALLEHAAIFELLSEPEVVRIPKTINLTVEYLRSGRPRDTFARADITKHGRRVANVLIRAWQEDPGRPIAAGHAHFLLRAPPTEPAE